MPVKTSGIRWRWYVEVLYRWRPLEGTKSTGEITMGRGRKNSRERERERAQYRFNDSRSFSIPSTIRTIDYRQESESPSTATPPLTPFFFPLVAIMLVPPRQLTVDRFYRFPSFATAWLVASFSTSRRAISSSSYPDSKSLVLSSRPAVDIASIESDVEGALSGSSGRPEYPPVSSRLFSSTSSGKLPEMTPTSGSLSNVDTKQSFGIARFSYLPIDSEPLYIPEFSQSLKSHELYFHNRKSRNPALKNTRTSNIYS